MKILVAEDDALLLKLIRVKMERDGYEVDIASNGDVALNLINEKTYDLLVTDIMMPFITGLELVSLVKNKDDNNTKVIVLSSVNLEKTILEAFKLGADDFITKPFIPNELSIRVKRLLQPIE